MYKAISKMPIISSLGLFTIFILSVDAKCMKTNWAEEAREMGEYDRAYTTYANSYNTSIAGDRAWESKHPYHKYCKNFKGNLSKQPLQSPQSFENLLHLIKTPLPRQKYEENIQKWELLTKNTKMSHEEIQEMIDKPVYIDSSTGEFPGIDWDSELETWVTHTTNKKRFYEEHPSAYVDDYERTYGAVRHPYEAYITKLKLFHDPSKLFNPPSRKSYEDKLREIQDRKGKLSNIDTHSSKYNENKETNSLKNLLLANRKGHCKNLGICAAGTFAAIALTAVWLNPTLLDLN